MNKWNRLKKHDQDELIEQAIRVIEGCMCGFPANILPPISERCSESSLHESPQKTTLFGSSRPQKTRLRRSEDVTSGRLGVRQDFLPPNDLELVPSRRSRNAQQANQTKFSFVGGGSAPVGPKARTCPRFGQEVSFALGAWSALGDWVEADVF